MGRTASPIRIGRIAHEHRATRPMMSEPDGHVLTGLRVIDAASFIAGPVAATILADLGAGVIKIEPPQGDPYRHRTGGPGVPESPTTIAGSSTTERNAASRSICVIRPAVRCCND